MLSEPFSNITIPQIPQIPKPLGSPATLSPLPAPRPFPNPGFSQEANTEKLTAFITALNGKDGSGSHLVTVPPGPSLADALISSPILAGEGGAMLGLGASDFEFGVDPSADPELALVRISEFPGIGDS